MSIRFQWHLIAEIIISKKSKHNSNFNVLLFHIPRWRSKHDKFSIVDLFKFQRVKTFLAKILLYFSMLCLFIILLSAVVDNLKKKGRTNSGVLIIHEHYEWYSRPINERKFNITSINESKPKNSTITHKNMHREMLKS